MINLSDQIYRFKKEGYYTFKPNEYPIFGKSFEIVSDLVKKSFLKYENGDADKLNYKNKIIKTKFSLNDITYTGYPVKYRYYREGIQREKLHENNLLYGRRAIILSQFWNEDLVKHIENENLIELAKNFLKSDKISLENASIAASYPGNTGESGRFHIDTPGFSKKYNNFEHLRKNDHLLNIFIHFSDIEEELAPLRVIPKSHLQFSEINNFLNEKKKSKSKNFFDKEQNIFEDSVPEFCEKPVKILGTKGTFSCMNSGLLHSATENFSSNKTRYVMIFNFSREEDKFFYKNYSNFRSENRKFVSIFKNKNLVQKSFAEKKREISFKQFVKKIFSYIVVKLRKLKNYKKLTSYYISKLSLNKKCLNVGAGAYWSHKNFLNLDFDKKFCEIAHDLNKNEKLPIKDNSLKVIYTSHNLEHLKEDSVKYYLKEFYRCLEPGGTLRIVVPDAELMYEKYINKNTEFWEFLKNKTIYYYDDLLRIFVRNIAHGVVDNFSDSELKKIFLENNKEDFLNFFTNLQNKIDDTSLHHKSWHSFNKMNKMLTVLNFNSIIESAAGESRIKIMRNLKKFDYTEPHLSFYIEARK